MRKLFILFLISCCQYAYSQLALKPSIGIETLPSDNDSVCEIPMYPDTAYYNTNNDFDQMGYNKGDTIPHFKLYTLDGDSMDIEVELKKGKPILIVVGNYTCPVFRGKIGEINDLVANYSNDITTYVLYVAEAHPDTDLSPYSGTVWTHSDNYNENILYRQPKTYGERKDIVSDMINNYTSINAPIIIDGPCNYWWLNFGPAPNAAYLITVDGVVFSHHGWFNKAPHNMATDIDSLLASSTSGYNHPKTDFVNDHVYYDVNTHKIILSMTEENIGTNYNVKLFDISGKLIYNMDQLHGNSQITADLFKSGVYICEVIKEDQQVIRKKISILQ